MIRHLSIFLGTFLTGALIALGARTATYRPEPAAATTETRHGKHAQPITHAPTPDPRSRPSSATPGAAQSLGGETVNSVCAICGMPVNPALATFEYQGRRIGFGCKLCAPKFQAEPDKYGPLYLRNEVIKR